MAETILIASNSRDIETWRPIADELDQNGYTPIVYESDRVADGSVSLRGFIGSSAAGLCIEYDNKPLPLAELGAAWYRRPNYFMSEQPDKGYQQSVSYEYRSLQQAMWDVVPQDAWLNTPENIRRAETKISQLAVAAEVGFTFPDTLMTNRWSAIFDTLPEHIIFKPASSILYQRDTLKMMYAKALRNDSGELPTRSNPFPGLWQARHDKKREWRITVVGDEVFDAAIYTDASAKDDWRRHQTTDAVRFVHETFPDAEKEKCLAYMQKRDLRYGAFDFIEREDGAVIFLECNPNGQYGWLEAMLDFPISQAIAAELMRIAKARS